MERPQFILDLSTPGDSVALNPSGFVTALKSKLLAGQDPVAMKVSGITLYWSLDHDRPVAKGIAPPATHYDAKAVEPSTVSFSQAIP
ncbi:hypothetical protein ACQ86N_00880 [Puia sp. P3]|uniref:hypothetical protein n=1 Tax=Puia sp. P3 TaxID=3423952 RepID=UPI003D66F821